MSEEIEDVDFDELFSKWEEERSWLEKLIDDKIFKGSLFNYGPTYILTHPWKIIEDWCDEIRFAWQRIFRQWDDRVIWSIDYHLSEMLPIWLEKLKHDKHGIPGILFTKEDEYIDKDGVLCIKDEAMIRGEKEFNDILDKIANGFRAYCRINDEFLYPQKDKELYEQLYTQFENGMDLLKKYFDTLWD